MSFDDYTKKIIESVYGKDVRQAIYDALVYLKTNMQGTYTLPAATASTLGGVIPDATHFSIGNDGKLTFNPDMLFSSGCWFRYATDKGLDFSVTGRLGMFAWMQEQFFSLSMSETNISTTDVKLKGYSRLIDINADYNSDLYELFGQKVSKGVFVQHGGYQNDSDSEPGYAVQTVYPARKSGQLDTESNVGFAVRRLYFGASESDANGCSPWELYKPAVKCVTGIDAGDSSLKVTYSDGMISNIVSNSNSAAVDISDSFGSWGRAVNSLENKKIYVAKCGNVVSGTIVLSDITDVEDFSFVNGGGLIFTVAEEYMPLTEYCVPNTIIRKPNEEYSAMEYVPGMTLFSSGELVTSFDTSATDTGIEIYITFNYVIKAEEGDLNE